MTGRSMHAYHTLRLSLSVHNYTLSISPSPTLPNTYLTSFMMLVYKCARTNCYAIVVVVGRGRVLLASSTEIVLSCSPSFTRRRTGGRSGRCSDLEPSSSRSAAGKQGRRRLCVVLGVKGVRCEYQYHNINHHAAVIGVLLLQPSPPFPAPTTATTTTKRSF